MNEPMVKLASQPVGELVIAPSRDEGKRCWTVRSRPAPPCRPRNGSGAPGWAAPSRLAHRCPGRRPNQKRRTDANLTRAGFTDTDRSRATQDGAVLFHADLSNANLSGASLRGASLTGAFLDRTNLASTDVTGADFRRTTGLDASAVADLWARGALVDDDPAC